MSCLAALDIACPACTVFSPLASADFLLLFHSQDGNVLELLLGMLGLAEMWVLILYAFGNHVNFTTYENVRNYQ